MKNQSIKLSSAVTKLPVMNDIEMTMKIPVRASKGSIGPLKEKEYSFQSGNTVGTQARQMSTAIVKTIDEL